MLTTETDKRMRSSMKIGIHRTNTKSQTYVLFFRKRISLVNKGANGMAISYWQI